MLPMPPIRATLRATLSTLIILLLTLVCPVPADASWGSLTMRYEADGTITGTCHVVVNGAYTSNGATGDRATQFYVTFPDGQTVIGYCGNSYFSEPGHGDHAQPGEDDYAFTAVGNGDGSYNVTIHSENSRYVNNYSNYKATIDQCPGLFSRDRQRVYVPWWIPHEGDVEIIKVSENPELTDGNDAYSFEGAVYTVRHDDGNLSSLDAYLYVDKDGKGTLRRWNNGTSPSADDPRIRIPAGNYVIWEHAAPKGYELDPTQYRVSVTDGGVASITVSERPVGGTLSLLKASANPLMTDGNPCYSLAGAEYHVYRDKACTDDAGTLVTDENGATNELVLSAGTYYVKEKRASRGYALDPQVYEVELETGKKVVTEVLELPQCNPIDLIVQKVDAELSEPQAQGAAELSDAQFLISYYAGYYDDCDALPDEPTRSWTVSTNALGQAGLSEEFKVAGNDFYLSSAGNVSLPLGTVAITEVKAPVGYLPLEGVCDLRQVKPDGTDEELHCYLAPDQDNPTAREQVCRGGLTLKKEDSEGTGLAGARFTVINKSSHQVLVNGTLCKTGEPCLTLTSDEDGMVSCDATTLPYGSYEVYESSAPRGHMIDSSWRRSFSIDGDGQMVDLTGYPCTNVPSTVSITLEAEKVFDGTSQNRALETGQFKFSLIDETGATLETVGNDADGKVLFSPLTFGFTDIGRHTYTIVEQPGSDGEIVYDDHVETVTIEIVASDEYTLDAEVTTDDDGIVFHNHTVPAIGLPLTGEGGPKGVIANATLAMLAGTTASARAIRRRRH